MTEGDHVELSGTFPGPTLGKGIQHITYNSSGTGGGPAPCAPAALPSAPCLLVGREKQVSELLERLDPGGSGSPTTVVSAVAGLAGVGKTALALHAAHVAAGHGWFPGGVLFVDLRGYDPGGGGRRRTGPGRPAAGAGRPGHGPAAEHRGASRAVPLAFGANGGAG
ncbi:ATP-binding protein [Streptomyces sp. NPDC026206]|uniref:ATP-binding protein n=1 Tax=Streptomyces sp. NPDC026206 TaxID=3157089 RepID=UPI0033F3C7BE